MSAGEGFQHQFTSKTRLTMQEMLSDLLFIVNKI
jgi:hypothetical protein